MYVSCNSVQSKLIVNWIVILTVGKNSNMSKLHKTSRTERKTVLEQNQKQTFKHVCTASSISTFADLHETCTI